MGSKIYGSEVAIRQTSSGQRKKKQLTEMAAAAAPAPARLSAAGEAALKAEFGKSYDGVRLLSTVQHQIVEHFAQKGRGWTDVRDLLIVSKHFPERSERVWEKLLKNDIGISEEAEVERFLLWMHSRQMGSTAAVGHANDQVKRALDVLDSHGFTVSANMKVDMEAALSLGEAGSEKEQCCNALAVHILYLGRAPDNGEETWWTEQFQRLGGRVGGKVEITKSPTYQKAHAKWLGAPTGLASDGRFRVLSSPRRGPGAGAPGAKMGV